MKIWLLLLVCAFAAAAPNTADENFDIFNWKEISEANILNRNTLVNIFVTQLIRYIGYTIKNGSLFYGIPRLQPLNLDEFHFVIPAGLINLDLDLKKVYATGYGNFEVHRSYLDLSDLSLDLDISFEHVDIRAEEYSLEGDFFTAIPLYGEGGCVFHIDNFRLQTKAFLKQSENSKAILVDRLEDTSFQLPSIKSNLTGVIGGGDFDAIVNVMVEEVIVDYINRFHGIISLIGSTAAVPIMNPILNTMNTWRFLRIFL